MKVNFSDFFFLEVQLREIISYVAKFHTPEKKKKCETQATIVGTLNNGILFMKLDTKTGKVTDNI